MSRGPNGTTSTNIEQLLAGAERTGACAVPTDRNMYRALERRVANGLIISPMPGLYLRKELWGSLRDRPIERELMIIKGLAALHPSWTFCGISAALMHGLSISYPMLGTIHVANAPGSRGNSTAGILRHRVRKTEAELIDGVSVTSLRVTVLDCLRADGMHFREGLAIADSAARKMGWSATELVSQLCETGKRLHGTKQALAIAKYADPRAESGGESFARATMLRLGFVLPELQIRVVNPLDSGASFRTDGMWILPDGTIIILEIDGNEKRINPDMTHGKSPINILADERKRESLVSITGARIIRASFSDILDVEGFGRTLSTFGVPKLASTTGRLMMQPDSAMHGGTPAPNGAVIRNEWLRFERNAPTLVAA